MVTPNNNNSAWWVKDDYSRDEIDQLVKWGLDHFWTQNHQMADLIAADGYNIMVKGDDCYIWDIEGNKYIDAMAGLFLKNIGHNHPEIAKAVSEQMTTLAYTNSGAYSSVPGILLSRKLSELAPGDLTRSFFCGGGSEAVEIALKMARQYQYLSGKNGKTKIISRRGQYHGSTRGPMSVGSAGRRGPGIFDSMLPGGSIQVDPPYCYKCPWGFEERNRKDCCMQSPRALENIIQGENPDTIAAFIATPIPNGSQIPADEYWPTIREICDRYNIVLIADEIICGFGRLGTWFGMERFGITPDIMTIAKGLTGGELPVGGVVASEKIADAFDNAEGPESAFQHGVTYGGHPAVMTAALKNIEIMEHNNLVANADQMGQYLYDKAMGVLQENHPSVGFIGGGMGLLMSIELVQSRKTKEPYPGGPQGEFAKYLTNKIRGYGLATRASTSITLSPPLTITKGIIDDIIDILDRAIGEAERKFPTSKG